MELKNILRKRKKDTHKGDYGHIFIVAGSRGLSGAASLCASASLRSGAGLVTLGIPASLNLAMEAKLTEVMTLPLAETRKGTLSLKALSRILRAADNSDTVVIGPGLSANPETVRLIKRLIVRIKKPIIIDADGLNALSGRIDLLDKVKHTGIITPHPCEMSRLTKKGVDYIQRNRISVAKDLASKYNAVVVLKGFRTVVAGPEKHRRPYVNKTGNPGMATAGSGDVLTGIIAGFLAQGLSPFEAARLAVYIHGLAGDLAAKEKGEIGLIAGDILEKIPCAIKLVYKY